MNDTQNKYESLLEQLAKLPTSDIIEAISRISGSTYQYDIDVINESLIEVE